MYVVKPNCVPSVMAPFCMTSGGILSVWSEIVFSLPCCNAVVWCVDAYLLGVAFDERKLISMGMVINPCLCGEQQAS